LLRDADGVISGARGVRRQHGGQPWEVQAGAVVLATGGTSFRSHLLGARNNTGDGYLMGVEAGATLSGMEFTAAYTVAPARSTMTRTMSYAWASYYGADGRPLDIPPGPGNTVALARALMAGPVYCRLDRMPETIRQWLPTISPNVLLPFHRWGIDPWRDQFEITLHNDGTIRGTGGLRITGADCGVGVPGLYAAGDAASREFVAGATSGGGAQNSAWALSSAHWAAVAASAFARSRPLAAGPLEAIGQAGLRPRRSSRALDVASVVAGVQAQMHPYEQNLFRSGSRLQRSAQALDALWAEVRDHAAGADPLREREAAALVATARWCVRAALQRTESRGLHLREDLPQADPRQACRLEAGGLDEPFARPDAIHPPAPCPQAVQVAQEFQPEGARP
jgi:L-aspartate oxidase